MVLILHASDLHFGAEDRAALDWFMAQAQTECPDAILITGDLTMRARPREFEAACRWLEALPAPVSVEVGNHDLPHFDLTARFFRPYRRFGRLEAKIERPMQLDDVAVVPLRTTARFQRRLDWSKGYLTRARIAGAVAALGQVSARHRLVACHHPLIEAETRTTGATRRGTEAMTALAGAGATAILSGHVHDPFDRAFTVSGRTVRLIGAGTLSERVRQSAPGYNRLRFAGADMLVDMVTMADT